MSWDNDDDDYVCFDKHEHIPMIYTDNDDDNLIIIMNKKLNEDPFTDD